MADLGESLTLAFLVVLESLSPAERAVFLLHDVFGHAHAEIADMIDRSPAAVRKLASRARTHLDERKPRYEEDAGRRAAVADAFIEATMGGDVRAVMELLAPEVVFTSDGGGAVSAARRPVVGADRVARLMIGLVSQAGPDWEFVFAEITGCRECWRSTGTSAWTPCWR